MKKVLVLAAHPDDAVSTMGGTIRNFVKAGHQVTVFAFGNGDEDYREPGGREEAIRRYKANALKSYSILEATLDCLWLPDFEVFQTRELYQACIGAIRKYQPDIVFAHYWGEYFQHTGMATISRDAWNQAQWACSADLGKPWAPAKYYHFCGRDGLGQTTHVVDITDSFEEKLEAVKAFSFEFGEAYELDNSLRIENAYVGNKIGVKYAEAFQRSFYFPEKVLDSEALF